MMSLILVLLALRGPVQEPSATPARPAAASVLERDPRDLPRAAPEHWRAWKSDALPPDSILAPFREGLRAYVGGRFVPSLALLFDVLETEPDYPPALHQMGVIYFRLRRYSDSALCFERFLERAPGEVRMTRAYGHALYSLGQFDAADEHYGLVLAADPKMIEALRGRGLSAMRRGEPKRALELLEKVRELDPQHPDASRWIARILFDEERPEDALVAAERACELDAFEPAPWFLRSQILFELEREEEAETARARFSELDRVAQEARFLEARLLYDPAQPEVLGRLVELRRGVGDKGRVRGHLERLVALAPTKVEWRVFALDVLVDLEDAKGAARAAADLERYCGDVPETWQRLQTYFGRLGNRMRQVQAGERYLRMRDERDEPE